MNTLWIVKIKTIQDLSGLTLQTYIAGAVCGALFLLIAATISQAIKFEGGAHPKDPRKRKLTFWALLFACFIAFFLYNVLLKTPVVAPNLQSKFMTSNITGSCIAFGVYLVLGFILSKTFPNSKLGNWFSSKK